MGVVDADLKASPRLGALRAKLAEMFQLDRGDLDFGIYRIMNMKRDEVLSFLDRDLLPQVREALLEYRPAERSGVQAELDRVVAGIRDAGFDPEASPKVKELRARLAEAVDLAALEQDVYGHLFTFFRRYYHEGDFLSLRRYRAGTYAIPYEGEEVKLHWANADQYYVKSAETLRSYAFRTGSGRRVRFELAAASTVRDNNKAQAGKERRFVLHTPDPVAVEAGDLVVRFEYRPLIEDEIIAGGPGDELRPPPSASSAKRRVVPKQEELSAAAVATVLEHPAAASWRTDLEPVLARHLAQFTARHTFDYFIHKDLGGFLRRELDFYIKNEVLHLDDIDHETVPMVEQNISRIRAIRRIAHKIIDFLAQVEDFQKRLWLKKKFVVRTDWCVTLDRVPEDLYPEIAAKDAQRAEWVRLFAIDDIKADLAGRVGYSAPLSVDFLKANPYLVVDTAFFPADFTDRLLAEIDDLDAQTDGVLVHGENFQALNLLQERYRGRVKCIYIDPPYNTDAEPIMYKNGYKSSSWASLIENRLMISRYLLDENGILCATIDDFQQRELSYILQQTFGASGILGTVAIRANPSGRPTPTGFGQSHEYAIFAANGENAVTGKLTRGEEQAKRYKETDGNGDSYMWELFRKRGSGSERADRRTLYYPLYASPGGAARVPKMTWNESAREWIVQEAPLPDETIVFPIDENGVQRRWRGKSQNVNLKPENYLYKVGGGGSWNVYYRYYQNKDGVIPTTCWIDSKYSATEHGTGVIKDLFTEYNAFSYPKSIYAVEDCLLVSGAGDIEAVCLDYFAGSGTTGHAIINMNREDQGSRKYVLVEMGEYFDRVTKSRILKAAYSKDWKDGKPVGRQGVSQCVKVIQLESYEDVLDNLALSRDPARKSLLDREPAMREGFMLRYLLDADTAGSPSLLNLAAFIEPFSYTLRLTRNDEARDVTIDLPETFNYLLGLTVDSRQRVRGVLAITGTTPDGDRALVLWRSLSETTSEALDAWFRKSRYSTQDMEFDVIYVNGDNNLENLRRPDETWKVRLIEEYFKKLMFDVRDV